MISRTELLIQMGELMPYEDFMKVYVEKVIKQEAINGKHSAVITFPEKVNKEYIDQFYIDIKHLGYELLVGSEPYNKVIVKW